MKLNKDFQYGSPCFSKGESMETTIAIQGLQNTYKLYHITDLHLTKIGEDEPQYRHDEAALRAKCILRRMGLAQSKDCTHTMRMHESGERI